MLADRRRVLHLVDGDHVGNPPARSEIHHRKKLASRNHPQIVLRLQQRATSHADSGHGHDHLAAQGLHDHRHRDSLNPVVREISPKSLYVGQDLRRSVDTDRRLGHRVEIAEPVLLRRGQRGSDVRVEGHGRRRVSGTMGNVEAVEEQRRVLDRRQHRRKDLGASRRRRHGLEGKLVGRSLVVRRRIHDIGLDRRRDGEAGLESARADHLDRRDLEHMGRAPGTAAIQRELHLRHAQSAANGDATTNIEFAARGALRGQASELADSHHADRTGSRGGDLDCVGEASALQEERRKIAGKWPMAKKSLNVIGARDRGHHIVVSRAVAGAHENEDACGKRPARKLAILEHDVAVRKQWAHVGFSSTRKVDHESRPGAKRVTGVTETRAGESK